VTPHHRNRRRTAQLEDIRHFYHSNKWLTLRLTLITLLLNVG